MYVMNGGSEQDISQLFVASLSNLEQQIHQVVFPCLEIGKVVKKKPRNSINSYLLATLMVFCNTVESFKAVEVNFCGLPHFYKSVGM